MVQTKAKYLWECLVNVLWVHPTHKCDVGQHVAMTTGLYLAQYGRLRIMFVQWRFVRIGFCEFITNLLSLPADYERIQKAHDVVSMCAPLNDPSRSSSPWIPCIWHSLKHTHTHTHQIIFVCLLLVCASSGLKWLCDITSILLKLNLIKAGFRKPSWGGGKNKTKTRSCFFFSLPEL